jgi:SAM-dependent methyltransferase
MNQSATADRKAQSLLNCIAQQGPYSARKRLLDFGCGGGYFLAHAVCAGWSAMGFDVGEAALETCRAHQLVATGQFSDLEPAGFDVVILNHVFEHIEDPVGLLRSLRTLLGPQGMLFIEVPNVRSARARLSLPILSRRCNFDERHRAFPIHLWYFSPTTLTRLVRSAGFEPVLVTTTGMGLEELRRSETREECAPATNSPAQRAADGPRPKSRLQPAKEVIKRIFYGWGLGENVLLAARPGSSRRL